MKKVAVIMGSDSDLKVRSGCIKKLREFGVPRRRSRNYEEVRAAL